ncbi:MAG: hypothetical protein QOI10_4306 [Solirubrobacterales bacterium]|jgi:hypothetical protein|nr:hypothetical protein [Solirubrobacterales bacterium]
MLRPDLFGAFATHSGDSLSEAQYIPHFLWATRHLRAYDGDICAHRVLTYDRRGHGSGAVMVFTSGGGSN